MEHKDAHYKKMTESPVERLIVSLSVPTVITMLTTSVYNMADAFFVSRIGTSASGAVGVVYSLMAMIQAVGFMLGMGSGSIISRLLGRKEIEEASSVASGALSLGIFIGAVFMIAASFFVEELMLIFGATDTILPYAVSYGRYIIYGTPVMIGSFVMNNLLRSQGKAKYALLGIGSGGVINILLDPLFIFTFNLGTAGAALATLLSQCISFVILLLCLVFGDGAIKPNIKKIPYTPKKYLKILRTGLPSLSRQGMGSIAATLLNRSARMYGDAAVAAMSITGKLFMLIFAVLIGVGQGFQPVAGFNYGAKKYERVKRAFLFTLIMGAVLMTVLSVPVAIFPEWIMSQFTVDDMQVIEIGKRVLRLQCLVLPLVPLNTVCNMTYQTIGKSWTATFLSCMRQGLFFVPIILFLTPRLGLFGLEISQPLADLGASLLCIPFAIKFLKDLNRKKTLG